MPLPRRVRLWIKKRLAMHNGWWQERHPAHKKPHFANPKRSFSEQVEGVGPEGERLTQVHLEKWLLNSSST